MSALTSMLKRWKRAGAEQDRRDAQAERAVVYIARDGRGHVIKAR